MSHGEDFNKEHDMSEKTIYDLELHEKLILENGMESMRVPGGWLYDFPNNGGIPPIFVPYNEEFKNKKELLDICPSCEKEFDRMGHNSKYCNRCEHQGGDFFCADCIHNKNRPDNFKKSEGADE